MDTTDEWILSRTGIKERHILKGDDQGTSVMGIKAVENLLAKTGVAAADIDLIICATTTPDLVFPATANIISAAVGATKAFSFDMQAACSGFMYALATGSQFIATGTYKKVVVVGADKMSSIIDYTDRSTCIIFGDGAGAVFLEPNTDGLGLLDQELHSDGHGEQYLHQKAGGSRRPPSAETVARREHYVYQEGAAVFKFAVKNMADVAAQVIGAQRPHGRNHRLVGAPPGQQAHHRRHGSPRGHRSGKGDAQHPPLRQHHQRHHPALPRRLRAAACARATTSSSPPFGGGFTWGALYLKWAYDGAAGAIKN